MEKEEKEAQEKAGIKEEMPAQESWAGEVAAPEVSDWASESLPVVASVPIQPFAQPAPAAAAATEDWTMPKEEEWTPAAPAENEWGGSAPSENWG